MAQAGDVAGSVLIERRRTLLIAARLAGLMEFGVNLLFFGEQRVAVERKALDPSIGRQIVFGVAHADRGLMIRGIVIADDPLKVAACNYAFALCRIITGA